jgi:hypothetical protein
MVIDNIDYFFIGHICSDIVPGGRALGGTCSYGVPTVNAFGYKSAVLTSAMRDDPLIGELSQHADVVSIPSEHSTTYKNVYFPEGRVQYLSDVAAPIGVDSLELVPEHWKSAPIVHIAPMADEVDPQIVHSFSDRFVVVTPQGWMRNRKTDNRVTFKRWFDPEIVRAVDLVVFSEEDIAEAPDLEQAFAKVARHLVITQGDLGGTYYHEGRRTTYEAHPIETKELTGAGDVFTVSLACAWRVLNGDMIAALNVAAILAAYSLTRVGFDSAPTPEEVRSAFEMVTSQANKGT